MRIAVFDTYVTKKNGTVMHFDILVPTSIKEEAMIHLYGKEYLKSKGEEGQPLTSKECRYCHVEEATEEMIADMGARGYTIIEIEGCNG